MIISPGRNFIFVHIPKTGGTSLALALEGRAMKDDILIGDTPKAKRRKGRLRDAQSAGRLWKHSTLRDIEGLVSRDFIQQAFSVTLVRNPFDRLVSYYHWLRDQSFDHPAVHLAQEVAFDAFLREEQTQTALRLNPYESYMQLAEGGSGTPHFIRLEHFEQDARPLWQHLGFAVELPHKNASNRSGDYRSYYNAESRALVESICAADIERFDYSFLG
ncbi:MAG: sulfotransferase family 2 domain-containing protein [Roseovarius sp.]|nr:sulfotransferase family 2 domain-containing protein [Roseovarius sp.]